MREKENIPKCFCCKFLVGVWVICFFHPLPSQCETVLITQESSNQEGETSTLLGTRKMNSLPVDSRTLMWNVLQ